MHWRRDRFRLGQAGIGLPNQDSDNQRDADQRGKQDTDTRAMNAAQAVPHFHVALGRCMAFGHIDLFGVRHLIACSHQRSHA
jgi:hypothetical protein